MSQMTRIDAAMLAAVARNWHTLDVAIWRLAGVRSLLRRLSPRRLTVEHEHAERWGQRRRGVTYSEARTRSS